MTALEKMGAKAKESARKLAVLGAEKNEALMLAAQGLRDNKEYIIEENKKDLDLAVENKMSASMQDRLKLDEERIEGMAKAMEEVARESDPVGRVLSGETRPNGLKLEKITVPLGVIGIIYESRPNVTSDCAALCIKAGSSVILRGGKEAFNSNSAITKILREGISKAGVPEDCIQLVQNTSRKSAQEMMELTSYLDVLIPRGGAGLINSVKQNSKVPVIETGAGNCHVYVDKYADIDMAANIVFNAKTSRPSVCNAIETVLVHQNIAGDVLPAIKSRLDEKEVEIRADERTMEIIDGCTPATEEDWETEYGDYILAIKIVDSIKEAIDHIEKYSTHHSEAIITESVISADKFIEEVNSAAVYVNASTRFTDGGEFGLGAEIGISTQKIHARGPMGLAQLVSYKFVIRGKGNVR